MDQASCWDVEVYSDMIVATLLGNAGSCCQVPHFQRESVQWCATKRCDADQDNNYELMTSHFWALLDESSDRNCPKKASFFLSGAKSKNRLITEVQQKLRFETLRYTQIWLCADSAVSFPAQRQLAALRRSRGLCRARPRHRWFHGTGSAPRARHWWPRVSIDLGWDQNQWNILK